MTGREQDRMRAIVERAPVGVFEMDAEYRCVYVNARWCEMAGMSAEEALGDGYSSSLHPDDTETILAEFARAHRDADDFCLDFRWTRPDGQVRWFHSVGHTIDAPDGSPAGYLAMSTDVTDQRLAEDRLHALVEHSSDVILLMDPLGDIRFVNATVEPVMGYRQADLIGRSAMDLVHPEDLELALESLAETIDLGPGRKEPLELRVRHADGHWVTIELIGNNLLHDPGVQGIVLNVRDISERLAAQEALLYNEARLSALFNASTDIIAVLEPDGTWHASPAGTRILGHPTGYEPEGGLLSLVHTDDLPIAAEALGEVIAGTRRRHEGLRVRVRHADGTYRHFECFAENLVDDPHVGGVVITARDISDQKEAEDARAEAEARFRAAFERSPLGIAVIGLDGRFIDVNEALCAIVGRPESALVGEEALALVHHDDRDRIWQTAGERIGGTSNRKPEPVRLLHHDGHTVWVLTDMSLVHHADDTPAYAIALVADVTELKQLEARLEHQAFHDPLTGLPNRARLREMLERAWAGRDTQRQLAVLFVDLDRFKEVNDTAGHDAGDELLMLVARRLRQAVRGGDGIARFGGDEFVVVCEGVEGRAEAAAIAGRIRESLSRSYTLSSGPASIAACVGVALDDGHTTVEELLRDADVAAYRAKDLGRNRVEVASRGLVLQPSQSGARSSR